MSYNLRQYKIVHSMMVFVIIGILIGSCLLVYMTVKEQITSPILPSQVTGDVLCRYSGTKLWLYLLRKRSFLLVVYVLVALVTTCSFAACFYGLLLGGYYGFVISGLLLQNGWHGLKTGMVCFFPHFIFYTLAILCMGMLLSPVNTSCGYPECNKKRDAMRYFVKIFVIIFLTVLGIITETKMINFF